MCRLLHVCEGGGTSATEYQVQAASLTRRQHNHSNLTTVNGMAASADSLQVARAVSVPGYTAHISSSMQFISHQVPVSAHACVPAESQTVMPLSSSTESCCSDGHLWGCKGCVPKAAVHLQRLWLHI